LDCGVDVNVNISVKVNVAMRYKCGEESSRQRLDEPGDPKAMRNAKSTLILDEKYTGALDCLDRYKLILVIYHIDRSPGYHERVHPIGDQSTPERGVLATRSPCRPAQPHRDNNGRDPNDRRNKIRVTGLDA
jgi:hypothetical protein